MPEIVIFGGTTEGRREAERLFTQGNAVTVSVTSAYARSLLPPQVKCHVGVLNRQEMLAWLSKERPGLVIDATHPYAVQATRNIRACCAALGIPYERIERPPQSASWRQDVQHVPDAGAAAQALQSTEGPVLLTTGSHTLLPYVRAVDPARLFVRVLSTREALELCAAAGILSSHIIAMQGPFTRAFNAALYDQWGIRAMVTKDSGQAGGVEEKVIPALERQIHIIMIDRPKEETCAEKR